MSNSTPEKRCSTCKESFPATTDYFHRNKRSPDGLNFRCKVCAKAYSQRPEVQARRKGYLKAYADKHKERLRVYHKEYHSRPEVIAKEQADYANPEKRARTLETKRKLYSNPEKRMARNAKERARRKRPEHLAKQREYRQRPEVRARRYKRSTEQLERKRFHNRAYQSKPESKLRARAHVINRRSREKSAAGKCAPEQVQELLRRQKYTCYYCQNKFVKRNDKYVFHIDHTFPLSRVSGDIPANDISYLVLACPTCNLKKHDKYPWEFHEGGRLL